MTNSNGQTAKRKFTMWEQFEWNAIFRQIWKRRQAKGATVFNLSLVMAKSTDVNITPAEFNEAQREVLTEDRQRRITSVEKILGRGSKYLAEFDHLAPPSKFDLDVSSDELVIGMSSPEHPPIGHNGIVKQLGRKPRVSWGSAKWQGICEELVRRNPMLLSSDTLIGVKIADVQSAARIVYPGELHPLFNATKMRETLLSCMVVHKQNIANAELQANAERVRIAQAELEAAAEAERNKVDSPADVLMKNFAAELAKQMLPQLEAALIPRIEAMMQTMLAAIQPQLAGQFSERINETMGGKRTARIAVIGIDNHSVKAFEAKLTNQFPKYRITVYGRDPHNLANCVRKCDLVLCATDRISHQTVETAKSAAAEGSFRRVSGGESAVIHQINVWKTDAPAVAH